MLSLDPDVLRSFIAIAETGGFSRAGDAVNKTQSTISMQMKRLEEQVGLALFRKEGRRSVLTRDGHHLLEFAHRIVRLNDEAAQMFHAPELSGAIRFGTPDEYANAFMPEILARFARTHPCVEVSVVCDSSSTLARMIEAHEVDVALVTCETPQMNAEIVRRETLHWVTSACHDTHLCSVLPIALEQVGCLWRKAMIDALDQSGRAYRHAYIGSSGTGVLAAVNSGFAIAALPLTRIQSTMRILSEADGFPTLEPFNIGLLRSKAAEGRSVTNSLAKHIVECLCEQEVVQAASGIAA